MSDIRTIPPLLTKTEWNALMAHGLAKGQTYIMDKDGIYYMAVKGVGSTGCGTVAFGGSGDAGGIDGTDFGLVANAALDACASNTYGGTLLFTPGQNYEIVDDNDTDYYSANCLKPTKNTVIDFNGATMTTTSGLNTAILLGSYYIGKTDEIDVENIVIKNGKLRSSANMANGIGICTEGDSHVENVLIENMDMFMAEGDDLNFAGVAFEFSPTANTGSYVKNFVIERCRIENIRAAVQIQGITGNDYSTNVSNFHIRNNTFINCPWGGFWLSKIGLESSFVENNLIVDCGSGYAGIFMVPTGATNYVLKDLTIQNNKILNPTTPSDFGIEIERWGQNIKIINNTISNIVKNPIYLASNHYNTEISGNILSSSADPNYALINVDYDLTMTGIYIHDNICNNMVNQKWLLHNDNSPVYVYNNVPSFPLCCTGAANADIYAHYFNNFGVTKGDRADTLPGKTLGAGVNHLDVTLSAEMQAKLYIDVVACAWGYFVTGLTPTWSTTVYITNKTATGFRINFGTVTPDANQIIYYDLKTVV